MDEDERERLLERVNRQTATVGASLPEAITVDGEEFALAEFLIETKKMDRLPPETEETLEAAKRTLRAERSRRIERLESEPLDREEGEDLADEIIGIDRALNALEKIRHPDYAEKSQSAEIEDYKRWLGFLDEVQG
ncbi:MAG: DUF5788 family protein [Haloarculaceae archaeon]